MQQSIRLCAYVPLCAIILSLSVTNAADPPPFKSELFKTGKLVYSDDFDGEFNCRTMVLLSVNLIQR